MCDKGIVENNHCIKYLSFQIHFSLFLPKGKKISNTIWFPHDNTDVLERILLLYLSEELGY